MLHAQQASKRKRRSRTAPVLGAAGLSLTLVGGASANIGTPADMPARDAAASHEIALNEEEICDVSLATFSVFEHENAGSFRQRIRLAQGGCNCGSGCGGSAVTGFGAPTLGSEAGPPPRYSFNPAPIYRRTPKRTRARKSP